MFLIIHLLLVKNVLILGVNADILELSVALDRVREQITSGISLLNCIKVRDKLLFNIPLRFFLIVVVQFMAAIREAIFAICW